MYPFPLFFSLFLGMSLAAVTSESSNEQPLPDLKDIVVAGPYCGIYSLYACLDAFDKQPAIEDLLVPKYVGSFQGSTDKELIAAAEKYGLHGKCYKNMTWRQLFEIKEPMILHFRGEGYSDFNHWVAFLGTEGKHLRIIDVPHEIAYFSVAELLAHWDGTAIVLSQNAIQDTLVWQSRWDYLPFTLCILGSIFVFHTLQVRKFEPSAALTYRLGFKRMFVQTLSIVGIIGVAGILFHSVAETGFLKNPTAVAEVTRRYYTVDIPEISLDEMKQCTAGKDFIIFDARYRRDFELGAIPNAVNLPINSNLAERKNILRGIDKSAKIVLYCQSSQCGFADEIASFLKFNHYQNISLFRGGYREWATESSQP